MTAPSRSPRVTPSCPLCNRPDPLDLGVCLECTSRSGDGLVFASQSMSTAVRLNASERLRELLPEAVGQEGRDLASRGHLSLARVPLSAAEQVSASFAHRDIAVHVVPKRWGAAPIPRGLGVLLLSVVVVGFPVGLLTGQILLLGSPVYAGLLWILAQIRLRRPAAYGWGGDPWLPPDTERRIVAALACLPAGHARTLLSDAVRLGHLLWKRADAAGDVTIVEDTMQLLALAADAAVDLARVEEVGAVLTGRDPGGGDGDADASRAEALDMIEKRRRRLNDLLVDAGRAMGGANRRLPEAGGQGPELSRLADAIKASREAHATAAADIRQLLG